MHGFVKKKGMSKAPARFELAISCLLDRRFNQLSHGAKLLIGCPSLYTFPAKCKGNTCVRIICKSVGHQMLHFNVTFQPAKTRQKRSPNVGLEPTTLRLRVSCSTD